MKKIILNLSLLALTNACTNNAKIHKSNECPALDTTSSFHKVLNTERITKDTETYKLTSNSQGKLSFSSNGFKQSLIIDGYDRDLIDSNVFNSDNSFNEKLDNSSYSGYCSDKKLILNFTLTDGSKIQSVYSLEKEKNLIIETSHTSNGNSTNTQLSYIATEHADLSMVRHTDFIDRSELEDKSDLDIIEAGMNGDDSFFIP